MSDSDIEIVEEDETFESMTKSYQLLLSQIENGFGGKKMKKKIQFSSKIL